MKHPLGRGSGIRTRVWRAEGPAELEDQKRWVVLIPISTISFLLKPPETPVNPDVSLGPPPTSEHAVMI